MTRFRGHYDGKVIIPEEPVDFPIGVSLLFTVNIPSRDEEPTPIGKPSADEESKRRPPR